MSVKSYYKTNWSMMYHHKFSLSEIEDMMPFERDIYVGLTVNHLQEEAERLEQANQQRK